MYLRNCQYTSSQQVINKIMFLQFLCIVILSEMRIQVWLLLLLVFNATLKSTCSIAVNLISVGNQNTSKDHSKL
jgi:hypothetical protein